MKLYLLSLVVMLLPLFAQSQTSTLVAYYPLNGDVRDYSGNNYHGIARGGLTYGPDLNSNVNNAAVFDGIDDWIELPYTQLVDKDFVIVFRFKTNTTSPQTIISKSDYAGTTPNNFVFRVGYNLVSTTNNVDFITSHSGLACGSNANGLKNTLSYPFASAPNQWHCMFVQYKRSTNSKNIQTYLGGVGGPVVSPTGPYLDSCINALIRIGMNTAGNPLYFSGSLDNISIYTGDVNISTSTIENYCSGTDFGIKEPFNETTLCPGRSFSVDYVAYKQFLGGNTFTVQLSDATGSFVSPTAIGSVNSAVSGTISCAIPSNMPLGTGYRIRIVASNLPDTTNPNLQNITIQAIPVPVITSNSPVCEGSALDFTATVPVTNGTYSWTGPNSFTSNLQNPSVASSTMAHAGDYILTVSAAGCTGKDTTTVVMKPKPAPPVVTANSPVCPGTTLNLTALSPTPGVTYQWVGPSFTSNVPNPSISNITYSQAGFYGASVNLNGCNSASTSTNVVVAITTPNPLAGSNSPVCLGGVLNLSAASLPGASFSWTKANSSFTSSLQNPVIDPVAMTDTGDYIVTSTVNGCTSLPETTKVSVITMSYLGAYASPNDTLCEGKLLTVVTVPTNGGASPQFQWFKNNNPIPGATNLTYPTSAAITGDSFYCRMIATGVCATTVTLYSAKIGINVLPKDPAPSVTISSVPVSPIPGNMVTFTASVTNGGPNPQYQWKRNGADIVGAVNSTWSASNLNPQDVITVVATSSEDCPETATDTSNGIEIKFPTGVQDVAAADVQLYPNPNDGNFFIKGSFSGTTTVEIFNSLGQCVHKAACQPYPTDGLNIRPLTRLSAGVYMLKLSSGSSHVLTRFSVY
jgi:hypothetical protein